MSGRKYGPADESWQPWKCEYHSSCVEMF